MANLNAEFGTPIDGRTPLCSATQPDWYAKMPLMRVHPTVKYQRPNQAKSMETASGFPLDLAAWDLSHLDHMLCSQAAADLDSCGRQWRMHESLWGFYAVDRHLTGTWHRHA